MKDIPVIHVNARTISEGYEKSIYSLYKNGCEIKTQYDKPGAPLSKDCTLNLVVEEPDVDPMIHKAFPGGIEDLREYVYELHGLKDEWVKNINDPNDTRWEYTYHGRFSKYGSWKENSEWVNHPINQIEFVVEKLVKQPYTRQAQMITWIPLLDHNCYDPPCLQSIWMRINQDDNSQSWMNFNVRFRSNDAYGASFMNMFGVVQLVKTITNRIALQLKTNIKLGRMNWQADSYHIYGKDIKDIRERLIFKIESGQPIEQRTINFYDETIQSMYTECEENILKKVSEVGKTFCV